MYTFCQVYNDFLMKNDEVFMASVSGRELEIVKKDNRLVEAKYKLTINEQRIVFSIIGKIRTDDDDFDDYTINLAELAEFFGVTKSRSFYEEIQLAAKQLIEKTIDISTSKRRRFVSWLSFLEYGEGEASMTLRFDKALKPYLLNLQANFTQYHLAAVANFKNSYSIRFYEFLKMRQNMGKGGQFYIEYSIVELKELLGIPLDEYKQTIHLKTRIIEPSLKEIDTQTDLNIVQVDYLKKGRAIHSVKITAEPKKQRILVLKDPEDTSRDSTPKPPPEKRPQAVQALLDFGFVESEAFRLVKKYKGEKVAQSLAYVNEKKKNQDIKDPCSYLRKVLNGDSGEKWANAQKQVQENSQQQIFEQQKQEAKELKIIENERKELARMITIFEQLDELDQDLILDEIELGMKGIVQVRFKSERGAFQVGSKDIFKLHAASFRTILTAHRYL
jgi:plasmid replication initiation protein